MRRRRFQNGAKPTRNRALWALFAALFTMSALLSLFMPGARAVTGSFTVVNTTILPFNSKYSFLTVSRVNYVPHFALAEAGIGLTTTYAPAQRHFSLTWGGKTITFELGSGVAFDGEKQYSQRCTMVDDGENTIFVLPVDFLCEYFEWAGADITPTEYGDMLRIRTRKTTMSDQNFLALFEDSLKSAWLEANPTPTTGVSLPTLTPPSSALPSQSVTPSSPSPSRVQVPIPVFITFEGGPNELTREFLDILDSYNMPAAFFMRGERMGDYAADMRRIAASSQFAAGLGGYGGIEDFYSSSEKMLEALGADNDALDACTLTKTMLVRLPGGSGGLTEELRRGLILAGYRYWDWTVDARTESVPGKIYQTVSSSLEALLTKPYAERCVLMLNQDEETLEVMDRILSYLSDSRFDVQRMGISLPPTNARQDQCTLDSLSE